MVVDVNGLDYQHNQEDFMKITDKIDADLYGLFSEQRP